MKEPDRVVRDVSSQSSRRRAVRLKAPANLTVELIDKQIVAQVVDIGLGGLGLLTSRPLDKGASYTVRLSLGEIVASCEARVAHCQRRGMGGGSPAWPSSRTSGWRSSSASLMPSRVTRLSFQTPLVGIPAPRLSGRFEAD